MNTEEINNALRNCASFIGCYPLDRLPLRLRPPAYLIINLDKHNEPGSHWVAAIVAAGGKGEYFDSYGEPPNKKELLEFFERNCPNKLEFSSRVLQTRAPYSLACGMYSILFVAVRASGLSRNHFYNLFTEDKLLNEVIARSLTLI